METNSPSRSDYQSPSQSASNVYSQPPTVNDSQPSVNNLAYAGFGRRFLAYWVDDALMSLITMVLMLTFGQSPFAIFEASTIEELERIQNESWGPSPLFFLVFGFLYTAVFWVNYQGATPGKKLMAIKVIRDDGTDMTYPTAFIRWIGYIVSSVVIALGYLWVIWDGKKQAWHDKIAKTLVVKTEASPKTWLAVLITIVTILFFAVYVGAAFFKGFQLELLKTRQEEQRTAQLTPSDVIVLQNEVFDEINQRREAQGLFTLERDTHLCAYAQRRLEQLSELGRYDDSGGFIEDLADPNLSRTYFADYQAVGEQVVGYIETDARSLVENWNVEDNLIDDSTKTHGCVRMDDIFLIFISGEAL